MTFAVDRIDHGVLNCRDVGQTVGWYCRDPDGNLIEVASYRAPD